MVAMSVLCMLALSAALMLTAATPALLQARPSPPAITWATCALGLLATWAFLGVLAAVIGDTDRPLTLMAIPVLGAVTAGLLQIALVRAAPGARSQSGLPAVAAQLVLLSYYCPALCRIAALAWRCARRVPVRHIDIGMRAVASAAVAELALILARSAALVVAASGRPVAEPEIAAVAVAQGIAVILFIAGATVTAWFPVLEFMSRQGRMWGAYWRLHPLWATLSRAAPDVQLPPQPGTRFNARYRLHRRVIEIRDAELALRPYWNREIAGQAADAARSARLPADRRDAVVEAAVIVTALDARLRGAPAPHDGALAEPAGPVPHNDLGAETARLILVSRAIRRSPIVHSFGIRPGPA
jgi:Family of unknown function (DUF6545)